MHILSLLLGSLLNALLLYFSMVIPLISKITMRGHLVLFMYLFGLLSLFSGVLQQRLTVLLIIGGLVIVLVASARDMRIANFIAASSGYLLSVILNNIILYMLSAIWGLDVDILQTTYAAYIFMILFCIFLCLALLLWRRLLRSFLSSVIIKTDKSIFLYFSIILCAYLFLFIANILYGESLGYGVSIIAFNGIVFFSCFVLSCFIFYKIIEVIRENERNRNYISQTKALTEYSMHLEKMYSELRMFKHDYNNILLTLYGYIEDGDIERLKTYFTQKIMPLQTTTSAPISFDALELIRVIEIKSLITAKVILASVQDIAVNINIKQEIEKFDMDTVDLSRVLGIFLDNAIEAALGSEQKVINIVICKIEEITYFTIENSIFSDSTIYINQIFEENYSSKGPNRGCGLYNAVMIIKKYGEYVHLSTKVENSFFSHTLEIVEK